MKRVRPLMGLCPIGKFVFSNEDALRYKQLLQAKLKAWQVDYVDLENVLEDGLVKDQAQVTLSVVRMNNGRTVTIRPGGSPASRDASSAPATRPGRKQRKD